MFCDYVLTIGEDVPEISDRVVEFFGHEGFDVRGTRIHVRDLGKWTMGEYESDEDRISISSRLTNDDERSTTIIHELAHKIFSEHSFFFDLIDEENSNKIKKKVKSFIQSKYKSNFQHLRDNLSDQEKEKLVMELNNHLGFRLPNIQNELRELDGIDEAIAYNCESLFIGRRIDEPISKSFEYSIKHGLYIPPSLLRDTRKVLEHHTLADIVSLDRDEIIGRLKFLKK